MRLSHTSMDAEAPASSLSLSKSQRKKLRQKQAKKRYLEALATGEEQEPAVFQDDQACEQAPASQQPPSKRPKQQHSGAAGSQQAGQPNLSVGTHPGVDRPASRSQPRCDLPSAAEPAAPAAEGAPVAEQQQQQQQPPREEMQHRRLDLSHAATLIHAQLLVMAAPPGAPTTSPKPSGSLAPQLQHSSPAASGCHAAAAWGSLAGAGAAGCVLDPGLATQDCRAAASSLVTSTATVSAAAGGSMGATSWPVGGSGGARGGLMDSDNEDEEGEEGEEDVGPARADGGQAGDAEEDSGEACVPVAAAAPAVGGGGPRRRVFVYGNYHRYYGYRLGQAFKEDPRLQCFKRGWFANRRCLDVGCNEGVVTLAIATKFGCRSMMGVDIDELLIRKACTHLRSERSRAALRAIEVRRGGTPAQDRRAAHAAHAALSQTWFVHGDFLESESAPASFDTITCLSVVKWVHLNRGDAGLEALLTKFWQLLVPGGYLVLEPQPWKSYKAAAAKMRKQPSSPSAYFHRLHELELRPEELPALLEDRLGFRLVKRLHVAPAAAAAGFDRPMYLLRKPSASG